MKRRTTRALTTEELAERLDLELDRLARSSKRVERLRRLIRRRMAPALRAAKALGKD